ncbi:hypothetical protein Prudu_006291, partial [Prunus dulcis]
MPKEVKVGGLHKVSMWDFVQVVVVATRVLEIRFSSWELRQWGPISKEQEDEVEWVRAHLSKTERECGNLVTQKNLLESGLLQGIAGIIRGSTKGRRRGCLSASRFDAGSARFTM